ncbi:Adenylate kinase 7 [Chytridiales sp. JEL 0842]|nr:Adenylate kinase 7 [Chytridiales sp. JEL 0842]
MRVFVSAVDSAIGHNVSRLLASTIVGSRKDQDNEDDDAASNAPAEGDEKKPADEAKPTYQVIGTFAKPPPSTKSEELALATIIPGTMIETGDKRKDQIRRDAIEKFAVPYRKPKWVNEIVQNTNRDELKEHLMNSDVIIYDLNQALDEAAWAIEVLAENSDAFLDKPKTFVGISTVMTWAKTKVDQDDPDAFLAEDEYRRRKPHPNFKNHVNVEKNIIKFGKKSALRTYIVAPGLIYHSGDNIFHYLFKAAWHNEDLVSYGDGSNVLPTVHLDDLCNIIVEVVETVPENRYLLAIDDSKNTLYEITKAISESLGTGRVKKVPREQALLNKSLTQSDYDMLQCNLRLEPGHVKEMTFEWKYDAGLIENLPQLIQEYKDARGLTPLKIAVLGPPASGKTTLAKKLAEHYEIHYVEVENVVKEAVELLEKRVSGAIPPPSDDEPEFDLDADRDLLEELKEAFKANNGKYPEEHIINFVRDRLRSMPCRNQGYVLDGFPTTTEEASQLFKPSDEEKEGEPTTHDDVLIPTTILSLEASDDFLKERVMNLPDTSMDPKNSEEGLTRRLETFRALNTDELTVLNYFDELEIHPTPITIESLTPDSLLETVKTLVGKPHNYGPTLEQLEERRRKEEEEKQRELEREEEERARREKEEAERHGKAVSEWNSRMEEIRKQEQEVLEAQSVPLRNYLMKYVMPTLTSGLIDVCKVRPEDPIDYLAEYLFKHNASN